MGWFATERSEPISGYWQPICVALGAVFPSALLVYRIVAIDCDIRGCLQVVATGECRLNFLDRRQPSDHPFVDPGASQAPQ